MTDTTDIPIESPFSAIPPDLGDEAVAAIDAQNSTEHIIDLAFNHLLKEYTNERDEQMLHALNHVYGRVLEDRERSR